MNAGVLIDQLAVSAYTLPTDFPESDGTMQWDSTTMVLVEVTAMGEAGLGYTYSDKATYNYISDKLRPKVIGRHPFSIPEINRELLRTIRNDGQCGLAMMAVSAIDIALWDLKAKILQQPLCELLGRVTDKALVYGSGGFTSYSDDHLEKQLGGWANEGFSAVKMKIGRQPDKDIARIGTARKSIGKNTELFVDANGAFSARESLELAGKFKKYDVSWYEEPVSSNDVQGLHFIRERIGHDVRIAAGEYGYTTGYFLNLLQQNAVDVLQADATRCGGITGFLKAGALCEAFEKPFSFHCAPSAHVHAAVCLPGFFIGEYFHDHSRIERLFFDGAAQPKQGYIKPDMDKPGIGLTFKARDAKKYKVS
jgi:L-alanine-DL-glutamate epimerase-like enolase superfamily enzyme